MVKDGRQLAPTLEGIRDDHVLRYRFAAEQATARGYTSVLDVGCGCGYGSSILAAAVLSVIATDIDEGALDYGREHYGHERITWRRVDWDTERAFPKVEAAIGFEVVEHLADARGFLAAAARHVPLLVGSVPNQDVVPFDPEKHVRHVRHYTPAEVFDALCEVGWTPLFVGGQRGKRGLEAEIVRDPAGCRTLVFLARS